MTCFSQSVGIFILLVIWQKLETEVNVDETLIRSPNSENCCVVQDVDAVRLTGILLVPPALTCCWCCGDKTHLNDAFGDSSTTVASAPQVASLLAFSHPLISLKPQTMETGNQSLAQGYI